MLRLRLVLAAVVAAASSATAGTPRLEPEAVVELIDANLAPGSALVHVDLAFEGEQIRLRNGHRLAVRWPSLLVLEFEGPYSSLRTGIRGDGCWFRLVEIPTGLRVGSGGGPCRP